MKLQHTMACWVVRSGGRRALSFGIGGPSRVAFGWRRSCSTVHVDPARLDQLMMAEITDFARRRITPFTINQMVRIASAAETDSEQHEKNLIASAQFLYDEIPKRLAHRVQMIDSYSAVSDNPLAVQTRQWHVDAFKQIRLMSRPETMDDNIHFTEVLTKIKQGQLNVIPTLYMALKKLSEAAQNDDASSKKKGQDESQLREWVNNFISDRVGVRLLIRQHIAMHDRGSPEFAGVIEKHCVIADVAQKAINDAERMVIEQYGMAPPVKLISFQERPFAYIPSHLHRMMLELLKNSMVAVIEKQGAACQETANGYPIRIIISDGEDDVAIKVHDRGGGFNKRLKDQTFSYLHTTRERPQLTLDQLREYQHDHDPMGSFNLGPDTPASSKRHDYRIYEKYFGFGFGLPIARVYARYFGGEIRIFPMDGYGTDTYIHLNRVGNIPEQVRVQLSQMQITHSMADPI